MKRILIVDDSEIDREVLKSILEDEFELLEADNGYSALDIILEQKEAIDAVLLDVSMPFLDGLSVLRILRENNLSDVSVFMITAEATKDNIEKASQYNIAEFIRKPFDRADIQNRVRSKLGVVPRMKLAKADIEETRRYIADLERVYDRFLFVSGRSKGRDERRAYFMGLLLNRYSEVKKETETDSFQIEMLCKAAYLCNIGDMLFPNLSESEKADNYFYQQHTVAGADMIQLNYSGNCRRFVQLCADICLHHHERCDGNGYPHSLNGRNISIYAQMCGLLERFDDLFFSYSRHNEQQFDYVLSQLRSDTGFVGSEIILLLEDCRYDIINYYNTNYI